MDFESLLHFVVKQQGLAGEVHIFYESGAFGYHLHRKLEAFRRHPVADPFIVTSVRQFHAAITETVEGFAAG